MRHGNNSLGVGTQQATRLSRGVHIIIIAVAAAKIHARAIRKSKSNFENSARNEKKPGGRTATGHIHSQ
jgi:hypothetical protein